VSVMQFSRSHSIHTSTDSNTATRYQRWYSSCEGSEREVSSSLTDLPRLDALGALDCRYQQDQQSTAADEARHAI